MAFYGLFIGIDRYASPAVNWLSCARRDAVALEALFSDNVSGQCTLLTDQQATRAGISAEFERLTNAGPDDTVVIAFSGHGSESHELITYDAVPGALDATAIPLDEVVRWFSRIPARHLVLLLDCCFSGGAGAKVFRVDNTPRSTLSAEARFLEMAGTGRIIMTASAANEPAWENQKVGHGYFTHFLLEAMRGAKEVIRGDRLPIYQLLQYVTQSVADAARQFGHTQNPTLRGTLDGEVSWPVFARGAKFNAAFPVHAQPQVNEDIQSLSASSFPGELVDAWSRSMPGLNKLQIAAINDYGVLSGDHLTVVAPTSSGKTMVGELAALQAVMGRRRAAFLLPLKALVADKLRHFEKVYGLLGLKVVAATGETDDVSPIVRGQYDIGLFTYEKFASMVLLNPHVLEQLAVVVIDEAQMLADTERGANLEFLITLMLMRRREGVEPQLIALTGVVGDTNGVERWLGGRLLRQTERPIPLDEGLITAGGIRRYIEAGSGEVKSIPAYIQPTYSGKQSSQDVIIPLVRKLVAAGQQVIVFREQVGETRGCAKYLARELHLSPATKALQRLPSGDHSKASRDLRDTLGAGVAFHNSHLSADEKRIIEEEFRAVDAGVRVIVATTTLAMGVNTPASSVVIAGLAHPGENKPYSIAEYKNLVGRAGRLGFKERGSSYLVAMNARDEHHYWNKYVLGIPENLQSRFLDGRTDPRSLIIRALVASTRYSQGGLTADSIADFLEASFGSFQEIARRGKWSWSRQQILDAVADLARHGLTEPHEGDRYDVTPLGRLAGESATEVESIIRLVQCLKPLQPNQVSDPAIISAVQTTAELDNVYVPIHKRTPKELQSWLGILRQQSINGHLLQALGLRIKEPHDHAARAKRAVAALAYISGQEMESIETMLGQHGGGFDGSAGPIRSIASRTADLIGTAGRVAEILHPGLTLGVRTERLGVRLTLGIPGMAVELGRAAGANLSRGDYLRLTAGGLIDYDSISAAGDDSILSCVDHDPDRLAIVRLAAQAMAKAADGTRNPVPILAPYAA